MLSSVLPVHHHRPVDPYGAAPDRLGDRGHDHRVQIWRLLHGDVQLLGELGPVAVHEGGQERWFGSGFDKGTQRDAHDGVQLLVVLVVLVVSIHTASLSAAMHTAHIAIRYASPRQQL